MRVYLPATLVSVAQLVADGTLDLVLATAVTADLRAALPAVTDDEDLELEALLDAAELSAGLLDSEPSAARRRVVLAADVPDASVRPAPDDGPAVVQLGVPVALAWVVSAHVDEPGVEAQVAAGQTEDLDLLWYGASELPALLATLPPPTNPSLTPS